MTYSSLLATATSKCVGESRQHRLSPDQLLARAHAASRGAGADVGICHIGGAYPIWGGYCGRTLAVYCLLPYSVCQNPHISSKASHLVKSLTAPSKASHLVKSLTAPLKPSHLRTRDLYISLCQYLFVSYIPLCLIHTSPQKRLRGLLSERGARPK